MTCVVFHESSFSSRILGGRKVLGKVLGKVLEMAWRNDSLWEGGYNHASCRRASQLANA